MSIASKATMHATVALAAGAALCLAAPHASADTQTEAVAKVKVAASANAYTHSVAATEAKAAQAATLLCGAGYTLYNADPLPSASNRLGMLFTYYKGGLGPGDYACAVFDNNTSGAKWMKLKMCENKATNPRCDTDEGTFSDYAGPVHMNNCPTFTALMKTSSGAGTYLINRVFGSFCD